MLLQELGENPFQKPKTTRQEPIAPSTVYDMVETAQSLLQYAQDEFRQFRRASAIAWFTGEEVELNKPLVRFNQNHNVIQALWETENENKNVPIGYDRLGINLIKGSLIIALDSRRLDPPAGITVAIRNGGLTSEDTLRTDVRFLNPQVTNVSSGNERKFSTPRQRGPDDKDKVFGPDVILEDEDVALFMNRFYDMAAIHGLVRLNEELRLAS